MTDDDGTGKKSPHYVDQYVGRTIRELRRRRSVSQEKLAEILGLTFQQVQKYEKGSNRVSASKLYEVSQALGVGIDHFFRGVDGEAAPGVAEAPREFTHDAPMTVEGREIDRLLVELPRRHRRLVLEMARALARESEAATEPDAEV